MRRNAPLVMRLVLIVQRHVAVCDCAEIRLRFAPGFSQRGVWGSRRRPSAPSRQLGKLRVELLCFVWFYEGLDFHTHTCVCTHTQNLHRAKLTCGLQTAERRG